MLPDYGVLTAVGPDSIAFLQAQLANDVRALAQGDWQWNCYLTPQGRVQSVFPLLRAGLDRLLLIVPGNMAEPVRERLGRYRLRSKVALEVDSSWSVFGELGDAHTTSPPKTMAVESANPERWTLAIPGSRHLIAVREPTVEAIPAALSEWRRRAIAEGIPELTGKVSDQFTPQALSLERLPAYSVKKGCYPGQEIVARTHFLGRSKRALARLRGAFSDVPEPGAEVASADATTVLGTVIAASALAGSGFEALAAVREDGDSPTALGLAGGPVERLAFAS
jgi:folate-binding protein YgfZ